MTAPSADRRVRATQADRCVGATQARDGGVAAVTGALGYTGRFITERLVASGLRVRSLTRWTDRPHDFGDALELRPFRFDDPDALASSLEGITTLYNTYWVRFPHGPVSFEGAVANSRALFTAAREAGVGRIVHVSITNPSIDSPLPYFRGKAQVEAALAESGVPHSIVRPTVVFGRGDVLLNNIAWLLRHFPVFAVAGAGDYRVRPVHVADVARLCVEVAGERDVVIDAVGPETFGFAEMVTAIRDAVGSRAHLVHVPPPVVPLLGRVVGLLVRDVTLTADELAGMMAGLVATDGPATGHIALTEWLALYGAQLGVHYANELERHYSVGQAPANRMAPAAGG